VFKYNVRKGLEVLTGQPRQPMLIDVSISIPAGADVTDPESVRAAYSLAAGILWEQSANIGNTLINNGL
jgi:hypothetical protein